MNTTGTVEQVISAFASKQEQPSRASHDTLVIENGILVSNGMPIGRWVNSQQCLVNVDTIRGGGWGGITHNWRLIRALGARTQWDAELEKSVPNRPALGEAIQVSARLLHQHGIKFATMDAIVLDVTADINDSAYSNEEGYATFEQRMRSLYGNLGQITTVHSARYYASDNGKYEQRDIKSFHLAGGSLIIAGTQLLWSSTDGSQYFCCEVPMSAYDAIMRDFPDITSPIHRVQLALRPEELRNADNVQRQGEFFFQPVGAFVGPVDREYRKDVSKWFRLSDNVNTGFPNMGINRGSWSRSARRTNAWTAHHTAEYALAQPDATPLVAGRVKDRQHGILNLQPDLGTHSLPLTAANIAKLQWHRVYHNTQIASYSADGIGVRID